MGELLTVLSGVALLGMLVVAVPIAQMAIEFIGGALRAGRSGTHR